MEKYNEEITSIIDELREEFKYFGNMQFIEEWEVSEDMIDMDWVAIYNRIDRDLSNAAFDIDYDSVEKFCDSYEVDFEELKSELFAEFCEGIREQYIAHVQEMRGE